MMRHFHRLSAVFIGLVVLGLFTVAPPRAVYACSCLPVGSPQEELDRSDAVFGGTVSSIEEVDAMTVRVTFDVAQVWKGQIGSPQVVTTTADSAACGYVFQPGGEYVVYARNQDGGLATSLCSRTQPAANASDDLAAFGEGAAPVAAPEQPAPVSGGATNDSTAGVPVRAIALWSAVGLVALLLVALLAAMTIRSRRAA